MSDPKSNVYGWPRPEQTTAPPDAVHWLGKLANGVDLTVSTRILSGPVGSEPVLEPGQLYCGIE